MFWTTPLDLDTPIRVGLDASMSGGGTAGADGIALVFADAWQGGNPDLLGNSGLALGYGGIRGVAVTLDTFQNVGEPDGNFVGIADGVDADGAPAYVATTARVPDLRSGVHTLQVDVTDDHLDVSVDGRAVLSADVALPARSFVGVTGANGAFTDDHVVTDFRRDHRRGRRAVRLGRVDQRRRAVGNVSAVADDDFGCSVGGCVVVCGCGVDGWAVGY